MNFKIRPLNTGMVTSNPKNYTYHHSVHKYHSDCLDEIWKCPCFCFLVYAGDEKILVDTGMADTERAGKYHHPGSIQEEDQAVYRQLEALGISCEEITRVIFTHLHWDHVYYCGKFVNAKFYVQRKEYEYSCHPIPIYHKSYEDPAIGIDRKQFDGIEFEFIDDEAEIIPGIRTYLTPGHSVGHQCVEVDTEKGTYTIVGDAVFALNNLDPIPEIHYEVTPVARFVDINDWWNSAVKIKERIVDIDHVLATHDISLKEKIKQTPVFG